MLLLTFDRNDHCIDCSVVLPAKSDNQHVCLAFCDNFKFWLSTQATQQIDMY